MLTIGEVSKKFNLPISTIRYYDREGLFPNLSRKSGIRQFSEKEIEAIRVFECLKSSGLSIKEIKNFLGMVEQGNETLEKRKNLFEEQKKQVKNDILKLEKVLDMVNYKCWYYEQAILEGDENKVKNIDFDNMPKDVLKSYQNSHQ